MNITIDSHQIFPNYDLTKINKSICLSDNPKTGLFLKENIHLINSDYLSKNYSSWVIDFIFDNDIIHLINFKKFNSYNNDKLVKYLLDNLEYPDMIFGLNNNDIAVDYIINNLDTNYFIEFFNENNNNRAVDYLINNPDKIIYKNFLKNNNDKAVDYILANINNIDKKLLSDLSYNTNDKIVNYLINNPKLINIYDFCYNNNDKAVKYIMDNNYHKDIKINNLICLNTNNIIFDYILNENGYDGLYFNIEWNYNPRLIDLYQNIDKIKKRVNNYMNNFFV